MNSFIKNLIIVVCVFVVFPASLAYASCDCSWRFCGEECEDGTICLGICPPGNVCALLDVGPRCVVPTCTPQCPPDIECGGGRPDGCGGICPGPLFCQVGEVCNDDFKCICESICGDGRAECGEQCDSTTGCGYDCQCQPGYAAVEDEVKWCRKEIVCQGYFEPFDAPLELNANNSRTIPLKIRLTHNGELMTDTTMSSPPVVNVGYHPVVQDGFEPDTKLPPPSFADDRNVMTYNGNDGYWRLNLGTKNYSAAGSYVIELVPGDRSYVLSPTCIQTFSRLPLP